MKQVKAKPPKQKIFKSFKEWDIEIRTIEEIPGDSDTDYIGEYCVEVGLYESLGEQGEILTLFYDSMPSEDEIVEDTISEMRDIRDFLRGELLTAREERYLEVLNRLNL